MTRVGAKGIFITVRTGSKRLPNKCLLKIQGRPVIEHLIGRVKRSKECERIVLCTTQLAVDDVLCEIAAKQGISFFRGPEQDKLERWRGAANEFEIDFFVTADGDDLFCEPELIDLAFSQYAQTGADFIEGKDVICGSFTYAVKKAALDKVCKIKGSEDTEMMWVYFTETGLFKTETLQKVPSLFQRPEIRMTLDYEEDFRFFERIFNHFYEAGQEIFSLRDIVDFLNRNPEVIKINQHLQQTFLENQRRKTTLVLRQEKTNES